MTPKKKTGGRSERSQTRDSSSTRSKGQTPTCLAGIPSPARFFLVVLSSLVVSSVLFTLTSNVTQGDLGLISKHLEEWWEVGGLMAWKAAEIGVAWVLGFDSE